VANDEPGIRDLIAAIVRIADALDRAVGLLEDLAEAIELPIYDQRRGRAAEEGEE